MNVLSAWGLPVPLPQVRARRRNRCRHHGSDRGEPIDLKYGGILSTAPIITTLAIWYVCVETNALTARQLAANSFYFIIPTALFVAFLSLTIHRYSFAFSVAGAYGTWLASALVINRALGFLSSEKSPAKTSPPH